jgi:predicted 3-demethylubiquinone-9 3-methyltransferase (glyoxalase superfamily)
MARATPFLWFAGDAGDAIGFYVSLFDDGKIVSEQRMPDGQLMSATFEIAGQTLMALNGRPPEVTFTEATSLFVAVDGQAEVDRLWNALTADGGAKSMCGWLKDKYGLSWQIIPNEMMAMFGDNDRAKAGRAMQAMLQMEKIDIAELRKAFDGKLSRPLRAARPS